MGTYFKPNNLDNHLMRLQIRSSHIYILFVSLLNIIAFRSFITDGSVFSKIFNYALRLCLIAAGVFSLLGFIYEHNGDISNRILTLVTTILALSSVGLFLINEVSVLVKKK